MKQTETASFLAVIKTAYPYFEITKPVTALWYQMLMDIDCKIAQEQLKNHIRTNKFAPTISDILNNYQEKSFYELQQLEEQADQLALEAYNENAVPMPDHILKRLEKLQANRKVSAHES